MSKDDREAEKEALVQGYVEGVLTPAESARLGEFLREDPLLARMIVENLQMEGAIREIAGVEAEPAAAPRARLTDSQKMKSTRRFRTARAVAPQGSWNPLVLAAMAAAVLICFLLVITSGSSDPDPGLALKRQKQEEKRRTWERQIRENQDRVRRAEDALLDNQRRRESLFQPAATPAKDPVAEAKKQEDLRTLEAERAKVEEELKDAIRKFNEAKAQIDRPEVEEKAIVKPDEPGGATTVAASATVLPDGEVYVVSGQERTLIQAARALTAGEGLATGAGASQARIVFPDRSLVVVGPGTSIGQIRGGSHKLVEVASGSVRAQIMKQTSGSMSFSSPYGVAKVLGTSLRIVVDPTGPGSMRLEVTEGKVQLQRLADRKTVDVPSGHYAVAVAGGQLVSQPMLIDDIVLYPMQGLVSGGEWQSVEDPLATAGITLEAVQTSPKIKSPGSLVNKTRPDHVAFTFQADPYREYAVRIKGGNSGAVAVSIPGGSLRPATSGTGAFPFPNFGATSGYVWVGGEGTSATMAVRFTGTGTRTLKLYAAEAPVRVDSVWLTAIKSATETQLEKTGEVTVLFGPETRPMPGEEYLLDSAKEFDASRGYGWVGPLPWTDIDLTKPKTDLHMSFVAGGNKTVTHTWNFSLPNGKYFVTVSCGVYNAFAQGPHMVRIQDKPVVNLAMTRTGEFHESPAVPVEVKDGRLVMVIGGHQSNIKPPDKSDDTIINYLKIRRAK
jgi:hypothetical protein